VILGIDPGLASTGYAVVERAGGRLRPVAWGVIRTAPGDPHPQRLLAIYTRVTGLIETHAIEAAAIESWFVHPVSKAAMGMAESRGAVQVALAHAGIAIVEYSPNTIKQAVTGSGRADKAQVRAMVERLAGVDPGSDHAGDALAAAICHLSGSGLADAIRRAR
jgi:crossover junction endodeoxyribonuclease RuvC